MKRNRMTRADLETFCRRLESRATVSSIALRDLVAGKIAWTDRHGRYRVGLCRLGSASGGIAIVHDLATGAVAAHYAEEWTAMIRYLTTATVPTPTADRDEYESLAALAMEVADKVRSAYADPNNREEAILMGQVSESGGTPACK